MTTISEAQDEIVKTETFKQCRDCAEKIKLTANVCHYCSRAQAGFSRFLNFVRIPEVMSLLLSLFFLGVAFSSLLSTRQQLSQATKASAKAETASKKVAAIEENVSLMQKAVLEARRDICNVANSLADIAEVIPRTNEGAAFQTGQLPEKDRGLLKDRIASLRKQCG
jgi:hypothetical protein